MNEYADFASLIRSNAERFDFFGGCSEDLIELAQVKLGGRFPQVYTQFLREFGAFYEIYGLIDDTFEPKFRPDAVGISLSLRQEWGLPNDFVIYDVGDGEVLCLKTSPVPEADSPIISFVPGVPIEDQFFEVTDRSFGAFLLKVYNRIVP